jgi:hypothetical protein
MGGSVVRAVRGAPLDHLRDQENVMSLNLAHLHRRGRWAGLIDLHHLGFLL